MDTHIPARHARKCTCTISAYGAQHFSCWGRCTVVARIRLKNAFARAERVRRLARADKKSQQAQPRRCQTANILGNVGPRGLADCT
eukprot:7727821-Pyramimonas_sp.AAC.1